MSHTAGSEIAARALAELDHVLSPAMSLYLDVHRHPELAGAEERTAGRLADWLSADGFDVATGIGGHGVAGVLRTGPGPMVMMRAELDGLPVRERTGLPYASRVSIAGTDGPTPVMHACGHDLHLAALAGAARLFARARDSWNGSLLVVGQPAEERLSGARAMLEDGLYDRFGLPTAVLAQHLAPMPAGMVAHGAGPMLAGSLTLRVVVRGRGGHAATPQATVDPVVTAAAMVTRLQTIVSREVAPMEQVVVSVGRLRAGAVGNIIADRAELDVTVRALSEPLLERVGGAVRRIVAAEGAASACDRDPEVTELSRSWPLVPDQELTAAVAAAHRDHFGTQRVAQWPASMASEDVTWFAQPPGSAARVPLVYWVLGSVGPRAWAQAGDTAAARLAALPGNHSSRFAPTPGLSLTTGIRALVVAAAGRLGHS
jgi:amidohydrolase